MKAKPQLVAKLYLGPVSRTPSAKAVLPDRQWPELPMPNTASVRDLAFVQAGFATQPWIIGVDKSTPDSTKFYGWVALKKSADMYKSLYAKGTHTVVGKGFDLLGTRPFLKKQTSLPPTKQNNKTFADLLTLKFNILLSQLGITTRGFGELRVSDPASPYDGFLVRDIAAACDSMMTFHDEYAGQPELYASMDSMLMVLNGAFSAPMDTTGWSDSLRLTGTAQLEERAFLEPSDVVPAILVPRPGSGLAVEAGLPERMRLEQNYPNPFNPTTTIGFSLPDERVVTITVYTLLGQQVAVLADHELFDAGESEVTFDAGGLASGVYVYRLVAVPRSGAGAVSIQSRKMVLMK